MSEGRRRTEVAKRSLAWGRPSLRLNDLLLMALAWPMWLACTTALALPAHYRVSQLHHMQWTVNQGVPTGIEPIAQTGDGFLWLGTSGGLFRFDGVEFERVSGVNGVPLLSQDIYTLRSAPDGSLWIGHHLGGISHLRDGRLVNYGRDAGLPASSVLDIAQDGAGGMWAATTRGLYRLEQGHWRLGGEAWNAPTDPVDWLILDRDRTLWVLNSGKVFYLRNGASRFERLAVTVPTSHFSSVMLRPDGAAMVCTAGRVRTLLLSLPAPGNPPSAEWQDAGLASGVDGWCAVDRDWHLWVAGLKGATRLAPVPAGRGAPTRWAAESSPEFVPLSSASVSNAFQDQEGNMWFPTAAGLDRFRAPALLKLSLDAGANEYAMAPAAGQGAWVGTSLGKVFRTGLDGQQRIAFDRLNDIGVDTLTVGRSGTLWMAGGDSLWRRRSDGGWDRMPRRRDSRGPVAFAYRNIEAITEDAQGAVWVSVLRVGVYRVVEGEWTLWGGRTDLPPQNTTALFTDAKGRVWFGHDDGEIAVLDGARLERLRMADGTPPQKALGAVAAFAQQRDTLWVGSEKGLWRVQGNAIHAVTGPRGAFIDVLGIAAADNGDLWLTTADGVVRIAAEDVQQSIPRPDRSVRSDLFNHLDGLPGLPKGVVASGARIWIATANGVVWTDPAMTPRQRIAPPVWIKSLNADGVVREFAPGSVMRLPVRTRDLIISYTAPSLAMPERVQFRFRLGDGSGIASGSGEWHDVGTRREAIFRDLAPGNYTFKVLASNSDGVWNETGATVAFVIPPTFTQTRWFTALLVLCLTVALWLLYLLRLRSVKERLRLRLEERMVERERIARELHDTFLQAVQGLVLRFHSAVQQIPLHEPSRDLMTNALDRADEVIADGRDAVTNLRVASELPCDFAEHLRSFGERGSQDTGLAFAMSVDGAGGALDPVAVQECERIVTEALSNAFRHARGTGVRLSITFAPRQLTLRVADDGRGFDPDSPHDGHWGLVGMRERAARLNGRLRVDSGSAGTTVTLEVPGRIAYQRGSRHWSDRLLPAIRT